MFKRFLIVGCFAGLAVAGGASAQEVMKREPPAGALKPGMYVYIDNGKCPKGQMLKVTPGAYAGSGRDARGGAQGRTKVCAPHP